MKQMILVFTDQTAAQKIRTLLSAHGFRVAGTAGCLSQAVLISKRLEGQGGVVVSQQKLPDGLCYQLAEYLPAEFDILVLAKHPQPLMPSYPNVTALRLPANPTDLIATVKLLAEDSYQKRGRPSGEKNRVQDAAKKERKVRTEEEIRLIKDAKEWLMERNHLTEEQAHRFLQKKSMDSGMLLHQTARLILEK